MKIITTLLTLLVCLSIAGAADKDGDKKTGDKPGKETGSRSGEGDKPGPRDRAKQQEAVFKQMDSNERFDKMDRNKDGELTKREFTTPVYESAGDRRKSESEKSEKSEKSKDGDKK
jgi:hypothetical protein